VNPQYILVAAVIVLMGWFAIGVVYNLRRGDALLKWMQNGLPGIGQKTTFRWLGTSVAELVIAHAKKPFRRLEMLLVLKPRDVFWMTILAYVQGREDIVIFRGQLTTAPLTDLELLDPKSWSGRGVLKEFADRKWERQGYRGLQLMAPAGLLDLAQQTLDQLTLPMQKLSDHYMRFSLRRDPANVQNFEVHVPFPVYRTLDAKQYFEALRGLAQAVSERD
jgi:hypothetical protein